MDNELKMFEEATRDTLNRWKTAPGQGQTAEENVKYAIIYALNNDFYRGFTSNGQARDKAFQLGKDGISYALLYNMIQLSDYRHQRNNESLGWIDSYIVSIASYCNQGNIEDLEEIFHTGLKEMASEQQALQQYKITDPKEVKIQRERMKECRERQDKSVQVAYDFANSIVSSYVLYNSYYQFVQADTPIKNFYNQSAKRNLENYYQAKKEATNNIQK